MFSGPAKQKLNIPISLPKSSGKSVLWEGSVKELDVAMMKLIRICALMVLFLSYQAFADDNLLNDLIHDQIAQQNQALTAEQAFEPSLQQDGGRVTISFKPKSGYYLYRDKFRLSTSTSNKFEFNLPAGILHEDEFMGKTEVYSQSIQIPVIFKSIPKSTTFSVTYQGCAVIGICYPPSTVTLTLAPISPSTSSVTPQQENTQSELIAETTAPGNELRETTLGWALLTFWLLGVGLSLTPCVYPMYPVLSAILSQQSKQLNVRRGLWLSGFYVLGIALTYTILGIAIAALGAGIQGYLQSPWLLGAFSLFYIVLAIGLLQDKGQLLPESLRHRLNEYANQQSANKWQGAFVLGVFSGLIGSPCTSAPLSGVLLFIAQHGSLLYGASALFILSVGMGTPLLLLGAFGGQWLPKAGSWMVSVKRLFALFLFAMPLWLLERFLPAPVSVYLWAFFLALLAAEILCLFMPTRPKNIRIASLVLFLSIAAIYPVVSGVLEPKTTLSFKPIINLSDLDAALTRAKQAHQPVMLDVFASWCAACHELDEKTFSKPSIANMLNQYTRLRIDVSKNTQENHEFLEKLNIYGLPHVRFYHSAGGINKRMTISGFLDAKEFRNRFAICQQEKTC